MKIGTISESLEDYLLIIHQLLHEQQRARVKDIAQKKGVKMSSVSAALKRLAHNKLIDYTARDNVEITPEGEILVRRLINRRDQVYHFLHKVLGVQSEQAKRDAGGIEHHVSLETLDRLAAFQGFIDNSSAANIDIPSRFADYYEHCLLGMPSREDKGPVADFRTEPDQVVAPKTLLDLAPGEKGVVKRLVAQSAIRQRLVDMGLLPNVEVQLERVAPLGDPIEVKIKGFHISLRKYEASKILIKQDEK